MRRIVKIKAKKKVAKVEKRNHLVSGINLLFQIIVFLTYPLIIIP